MFPTYPGGLSGIALLTLRSALGIAFLVHGSICLAEPKPLTASWFAFAAILTGALLTIGFLSRIVTALIAALAVACAILSVPVCTSSLFEAKLSAIFGAAMLLAIFLLGPGAFSVDSRLFGRREIIIPLRK